jgi:hypothetical protein
MSSRKILSTLRAGFVMASRAVSLGAGCCGCRLRTAHRHNNSSSPHKTMVRIGSTTTQGPSHMLTIAPVAKATVDVRYLLLMVRRDD